MGGLGTKTKYVSQFDLIGFIRHSVFSWTVYAAHLLTNSLALFLLDLSS